MRRIVSPFFFADRSLHWGRYVAFGGACAVGALLGANAQAQEFSAFGGSSQVSNARTYTWALEYQEGLGRFFAVSFMWLNEGHVPDHHRDGRSVQFWGRLPVL